MNLPPKLQRVLKRGKDMSQTKVSLQKRYGVQTLMSRKTATPIFQVQVMKIRLNHSEVHSDCSDPTVVGQYEGKTLVDFIPTGEQWQKEKSVIFNVKVKNINDNGKRRKIKITAEPG